MLNVSVSGLTSKRSSNTVHISAAHDLENAFVGNLALEILLTDVEALLCIVSHIFPGVECQNMDRV